MQNQFMSHFIDKLIPTFILFLHFWCMFIYWVNHFAKYRVSLFFILFWCIKIRMYILHITIMILTSSFELLPYLRPHPHRRLQSAPPTTDTSRTALQSRIFSFLTWVIQRLSLSHSAPWWANSDEGSPLHWRSRGSLSSVPFSDQTQGAGQAAAWRWPAARGQTGSRRTPTPPQTRLPPGPDLGGEAGRGDPHWEVREGGGSLYLYLDSCFNWGTCGSECVGCWLTWLGSALWLQVCPDTEVCLL